MATKKNSTKTSFTTIDCRVAGVTFDGRQKAIASMRSFGRRHGNCDWVSLERDRNSAHDPNAVKVVYHAGEVHSVIGYVPRKFSAQVASVMDTHKKGEPKRVWVGEHTVSRGKSGIYGMGIEIRLDEAK